MASLKEIAVVVSVTRPVEKGELPDLARLQKHFEQQSGTSPVANLMRQLLSPDSDHVYRLTIKRRDNRRVSTKDEVERAVFGIQQVDELSGAIVTASLCKEILSHLPDGWDLKRVTNAGKVTFVIRQNLAAMFQLKAGTKLSKEAAIKIAAAQTHRSPQALKKTILAYQRDLLNM